MGILNDGTYSNLTDAQLIHMVRENDNEAYIVLLDRYTPMINAIVTKYANPSDRDDLTQEANLSFYYAAQFFDFQSSSFKTFSSVCVERSIISALSKSNAKKRIPSELIVPLDDDVMSHSDDPESMLLQKEAREQVAEQIVNKLSEFELSVLRSFLKTGSYDETAAALSVTRKSVDNALLRVRRKLDSLK